MNNEKDSPPGKNTKSNILVIVEDDPDQKSLLVNFALDEIKILLHNENTNDEKKQRLKNIKIISASNIRSLKKAASAHENALMALLDCNIPDEKGGKPHDQFVKTNHKITGQHKSVDIVRELLPGTPITMVSSMNRFQKIVTQYYQKEFDFSVNFISKKDVLMIQRNIRYYLRQYLK